MIWKFLPLLVVLISGSESLSCYQCSSPNGECSTGKCDGSWCSHSVVRNSKENKYIVRKDCANINVLRSGKDDCNKESAQDGSETFNCFCNSQELCNTNDFFKKFPSSGDIGQTTGSLQPTANLPVVPGSSNPSIITGGSASFGQPNNNNNNQPQQQPFGLSNQSGQNNQGGQGGFGGQNQQGGTGGGGGGAFGLSNSGSNQGGFNNGQNPQGGFQQGQNPQGSNQGGFGGQNQGGGNNPQGQNQQGQNSFGLSGQGGFSNGQNNNGGQNNQQPFGTQNQNPNGQQGGFGGQQNGQNQGQNGQFGGNNQPNQPGSGQVTCYQCRSENGDCTTGSCVGAWCTMTSMKHDQSGVNQVVKGCELRDNPLGENRDLCKVNQQPGNMGYTCACKTSDNCNSKDNSERLVQSALQSGPSNAAAGGTGGSAQQGFLAGQNQLGTTQNPQYTVNGRPGYRGNQVYSLASHTSVLSVISIFFSLCLAYLLA